MGNQESFCDYNNKLQPSALQIPTTFNQGLQINLKNFKNHAPSKSYAKKASIIPKLTQKVEQTLKQLLLSIIQKSYYFLEQPLKSEKNQSENQDQGYEFPVFIILKLNVFYSGEWLNGRPNGKGKVYFQNGSYFQGNFKMGQADGLDNIFIYPDGSYYRGGFVNSQKNGYGTLHHHTKFTYEGTWKNGIPHGEDCKETYVDGSLYHGNFDNGIKQGNGCYRWPNGKIYSGKFKNGAPEGLGVLKMNDQNDGYFAGQFQDNLKFGKGTMKLKYGVYEGELVDGLMTGKGKFQWNDGKIYIGDFKQGKMNGEGSMKFSNGIQIIGIWQNSKNISIQRVNSSV